MTTMKAKEVMRVLCVPMMQRHELMSGMCSALVGQLFINTEVMHMLFVVAFALACSWTCGQWLTPTTTCSSCPHWWTCCTSCWHHTQSCASHQVGCLDVGYDVLLSAGKPPELDHLHVLLLLELVVQKTTMCPSV
jgi:hypothetical protein